ncbi:orotate phosphoribosyltransferase [Candidatus Woesearchaeota archaeon]|nr:orotate phosphoribosyltransferase [Candidatus Woesearchaeota archaeon]
MQSSRHQIARTLLRIGAVTLSPDKPYLYVSGGRGPIYCDNRLLLGYPHDRNYVRDQFIELMQRNHLDCDVIAGIATAGIPHAAWLADKLNKPMVYVRSAAKQHGKQNIIDGPLAAHQRVILIEDLINTGASSIAAADAVRGAGGIVVACVAIMTYNLVTAKEAFAQAKCPLFTLTDIEALLDVALQEKRITPAQRDLVLRWQQDPPNWAKKEGFA